MRNTLFHKLYSKQCLDTYTASQRGYMQPPSCTSWEFKTHPLLFTHRKFICRKLGKTQAWVTILAQGASWTRNSNYRRELLLLAVTRYFLEVRWVADFKPFPASKKTRCPRFAMLQSYVQNWWFLLKQFLDYTKGALITHLLLLTHSSSSQPPVHLKQ